MEIKQIYELVNEATKEIVGEEALVKEDLSNLIYYFEYKKDKQTLIRIGYHQSKYGNNTEDCKNNGCDFDSKVLHDSILLCFRYSIYRGTTSYKSYS